MSVEKDPATGENSEVSCANCVAACCRAGSMLIMTQDEVSKHRRAMKTKALLRPKDFPQQRPMDQELIDEHGNRTKQRINMPVPRKYGMYILLTDCGHIADDFKCDAYKDRPEACVKYEVGSPECLAARALFGLDGHEQVQQFNFDKPITVNAPRIEQA